MEKWASYELQDGMTRIQSGEGQVKCKLVEDIPYLSPFLPSSGSLNLTTSGYTNIDSLSWIPMASNGAEE